MRSPPCGRRTGRSPATRCAGSTTRTCRSRRSAASSARRSARSEEHTSELQSLMRISYAVFCLKKKKIRRRPTQGEENTTKRREPYRKRYARDIKQKVRQHSISESERIQKRENK